MTALDDRVLALAKHGLLEREIAANLGVPRHRVRRAIERLRKRDGFWAFESRYKVMVREREKQIEAWDNEGVTQAAMAERLGISPVMVHRIVHRIRSRKGGTTHPDTDAR